MYTRKNYRADILESRSDIALNFIKLSSLDLNNPKHAGYLNTAAEWAESHIGYMRNFPGLEARKNFILAKKDFFYLAFYEDELVGMFSLTPVAMDLQKEEKLNKSKYNVPSLTLKKGLINLSYFYVHDNLRKFGIGRQMVAEANKIAKAHNLQMTAHLLTSNVHGFYKKSDPAATFIAEDRSLKQPCELVRF